MANRILFKVGYLGWIFLILAALYFMFHPNTLRLLKTCPVNETEQVSEFR